MIEGKKGAKKAKQSLSQSMTCHVSQLGKFELQSCTHCGRPGHGGDSTDRKKHFSAYSKTYDNCGKKGHFRRKCLFKKIEQKDYRNGQSLVEDENADFDSVFIEENTWVMHVVAGVTKYVHFMEINRGKYIT